MAHPVLGRLLAVIYRHIARLSWAALLAFLILHLGIAWLAFAAAGEKAASLSAFWYFYVVTATTVGYGDITPATVAGRLITVLWIMPGGIILFTAVIGKLVQAAGQFWSRGMRGEGDYSDHKDHLVIFGWHPVRTARLVRHLLADARYDHHGIVLVARDVDANPLPEHVRFVRTHVLSSADALTRSGVATAAVAVVVGSDDNETLAVGLAIGALAAPPRIVAYFENDGMAALLRSHCPSAEANVSISVELLARSAQDPGSSEVTRQLLSPLDMPTQFSLLVPSGACRFTYGQALSFFKDRYDATVLAHQDCRDGQIVVNARKEAPVGPGDRLFFVADQRLLPSDIDWTAFETSAPRGLPSPIAAAPPA
jgi:voltage-gated potassium channel